MPVGLLRDAHVERAAELDVGTAAGHVGRDRDRAGHAGFGDDVGFLLVEARVQHREQFCRLAGARRGIELLQRLRVAEVDLLVAVLLQVFGERFGFLDRRGADQHRLQPGIGALDLGEDRRVFLGRRAIDLVVLVETRDRNVGRNLAHFELVDVEEFVRFGRRRAGHAGKLLVHAEIVLERDRGERLVLRLDRLMLLGLERLVQAFRVAPPRHHAAGELVDDHHLAVADDVVLVAREQRMRPQPLIDVMDGGDVLDVVERVALEQARIADQLLDLLHAAFGQRHRALLLVDLVVGLVELRDVAVDGVVEFASIVERTGDDQRRARLVDQDRVHFVDDGEEVRPLDHVLKPVLHVVAQIVEAVLVVGAVGDVAGVGLLALRVIQAVHDHAGGQPEERVDLPHPLRVAAGEVIVHRDHMHAATGERIQIHRKGRDQRLAFAGLHLGDVAFVQHHAADQLHVEMPLAEGALGRLADGCEGRDQDVVQRLAPFELLLEFVGAGAQRLVGELGDLALERVDGVDPRLIGLDPPVVGGTEELAGERADH